MTSFRVCVESGALGSPEAVLLLTGFARSTMDIQCRSVLSKFPLVPFRLLSCGSWQWKQTTLNVLGSPREDGHVGSDYQPDA